MTYKVIVAIPGKGTSFQLAAALKERGMLCKFVTTVYDKDSSMLMRLIKKFLSSENKKRADTRKCAELDDGDVIQYGELRGLIEILLSRFDKSGKIYRRWHDRTSDWFGRRVAALAVRENADAVIAYDTNAAGCFSALEEKAPNIYRIMDMSAPCCTFMKAVYEHDMELCPEFSEKLRSERTLYWQNKQFDRLQRELKSSQAFLVASSFVRDSLTASGYDGRRIKICPYGANFKTAEKEYSPLVGRALEAVYVGNVTEMKGIRYLLDAVLSVPEDKIKLTVVGAYDNSSHLFDKYMGRVRFAGRVLHDEVENYLHQADVFVFPSLGDGMGLAVLEAMACGLPCIVSENSGVKDAIEDGVNGFIVKIQDSAVLREKMLWFAEHPQAVETMGRAAARSVRAYTWENYRERVSEAVIELLDESRRAVKEN